MFRVCVVIPVYNAKRFIAEAVESALAQPETGEVLLIEDGSPDGSLAECERLAAEHEKVRLLRHPGGGNRGAGASRNLGLEQATCEFVAFLDADDYFLPGRFRTARKRFEEDAEADGVYEAVGVAFEAEGMREWWLSRRKKKERPELTTVMEGVAPERLFEGLVRGWAGYFCTDGIVVRRRLFDRTGLFEPTLRMCQDAAMWLKMAAVGRLVGGSLSEPVAMRRLHGENRIFRHRREHNAFEMMKWLHVLDWLGAQKLHRELWPRILDEAFRRWKQSRPEDEGAMKLTLAETWMLTRQTCVRPRLLLMKPFRKRVRSVVSFRRMRRIARETLAMSPRLNGIVRRLAGRSSS